MRGARIITAASGATLAMLLAACSGGSGASSGSLPACTTGHGTNGSNSTLSINQTGDHFTGVYLTHVPGMPSDTAMRYDVTGTVDNNRLDSTWTGAGMAVHVTGRFTGNRITLDNPDGSMATTVFTAAGRCQR
jgi:hypothetical protein